MAGGLSKFLSRILGGPASSARDAADSAGEQTEEVYNGYTIRPEPFQDRGQWITSGVIEKRFADEVKQHRFIRADMLMSEDDAVDYSVAKARKIIDEQGERLFKD